MSLLLEATSIIDASGSMDIDVFKPPVVYKKIYYAVLPLYCCIAALCYIDRTNLAYASFGLARDLGFSPEVYGLGSGLFFLGYSVSMIPAQMAMLRVGVVAWLSLVVCCWGAIAAAFSMLSSPLHFYLLRFCLGVAESSAFPAMWYYLSLLLPAEAMALPMGVIEASVSIANVASPLLAAALMGMEGMAGMRGWQWLFVSEGAPTIAVGLLVLMILPGSLHKAEFLTVAERRFLAQKLESRESAAHTSETVHSPGGTEVQMLLDSLNNPRVVWVSLMGLLKNVATNGMIFWTPILVAAVLNGESLSSDDVLAARSVPIVHSTVPSAHRSLSEKLASNASLVYNTNISSAAEAVLKNASHIMSALSPPPGVPSTAVATTIHSGVEAMSTSTKATLLCSIPFLASAIFTLWLGHHSQQHGERAMHLAVPYFIAGLLFVALPRVSSLSSVLSLVILCVLVACTQGSNSVINSYIPSITSRQCLPMAYAVYNAIANLGSLIGPWLIGEILATSGSYAASIKLFGVVMCVAAAMAWSTKQWTKGPPNADSKDSHEDDSISRMLEESNALDL